MSDEAKTFEDLSEDEKLAAMRHSYYSSANAQGVILSDVITMAGRMGQYALQPHYRAIAGAGLTAIALRELSEHDTDAAKALFQELADGLLALGSDLGLTDAQEAEDAAEA